MLRHIARESWLVLAAGWITATGGVVRGGDLSPPAGAVAPTHKTLTEVEPRIAINSTNTPGDADSVFKITLPGSYYLTGNVTGVSGKRGIEIASENLTLDLNGFAVIGAAGSLDGVRTDVPVPMTPRNIVIRNGIIRDWGGDGVDAGVVNSRLEDLVTSDNLGVGIRFGGSGSIIRCAAFSNGGRGITVADNVTLSHCSSIANGDDGFFGFSNCHYERCVAFGNTNDGFEPGNNNTMIACRARLNTGNGFWVVSTTMVNCLATNNTLAGINAVIEGCHIRECTALTNGGDGIQVATRSKVIGNVCDGNGAGAGDGAGIHATGSDNRIEGNNCTGSDRGIDVDAAGNIIVRNTCSGNTTNWDIAANNKCLVVNGVNAAAISGDSGGTSPGSADPNANFTY